MIEDEKKEDEGVEKEEMEDKQKDERGNRRTATTRKWW